MEQLLLHAIGDYWLQTDKQALSKKNSGLYGMLQCLLHCTTYSLPFLLIGSYAAVFIIFLSHFIVDRTKIIDYMIAFKNQTIHESGWNVETQKPFRFYDISNFGFGVHRPKIVTVWLYIACDNIVHLTCNFFALKYF